MAVHSVTTLAAPQPLPVKGMRKRTGAERAMLLRLDAERRLKLLRFIVPGLLILLLLSLPGAFISPTTSEILQISTGFITYSVSLWATLRRHALTASIALLLGVGARSVIVVLFSGPIQGRLGIATIVDMMLLLLPIIIAGIFTEPRYVAITTCVCVAIPVALLMALPRTPEVAALLRSPENAVLVILPIVVPLLIGFLMFVGTIGFQRLQIDLEDTHIALTRERAVERLREQFIANVNHELRTPLMALQSYLAMAQELRQRGDMAGEERMVDEAFNVADDLGKMVKSILNLRRLRVSAEPPTLTPLDVQEHITMALAAVERWNPSQPERDIHLAIAPGLRVMGEPGRLQEILTNLVINALKYSAPGTRLDLAAHAQTAGSSPVVEIRVRDYGHGIPPDEGVLLFEPFVRLERDIASATLGTGLGLATCRAHAQAMGGKIWFESSGIPGEGATFVVELQQA